MSHPIHILHIIPTLRFGGAERFVVDLCNGSDPAQFRYTIITFKNDLPLQAELNEDTNVIVVPKKHFGIFSYIQILRRVIREQKPDIIHTHLFGGDVWGRFAARTLGIPIISTEHNINIDEGFVKSLLKHHLRDASIRYTACSNAVKDWMKKTYGIARPIDAIHYGIPLTRFSSIPPITQHSPVRFLILGRLTKQKGQDFLLRVLSNLHTLSWKLTIVGDGEDKHKLMGMIRRLGLTDRVMIVRATHGIPALIASHDVLLVPSRWEGLGIVIMEAMAAGRLVVGSDTGGIPELIQDKKTGLLVSTEDHNAWTRILTDVCTQFPQYFLIAEEGRRVAMREFGVEKMIERYEQLYDEIREYENTRVRKQH